MSPYFMHLMKNETLESFCIFLPSLTPYITEYLYPLNCSDLLFSSSLGAIWISVPVSLPSFLTLTSLSLHIAVMVIIGNFLHFLESLISKLIYITVKVLIFFTVHSSSLNSHQHSHCIFYSPQCYMSEILT